MPPLTSALQDRGQMTSLPPSPAVVVTGAGINGLVAAYYLRRAGCSVTLVERASRVGGACVSELASVNGQSQRYALGASVLGLMPDFIFRETGLADRLETFVPGHAKRVYFPDPKASAWIHRNPNQLERELREKWGERGDVAGFRHDEAKVVAYLQKGYRTATAPDLGRPVTPWGRPSPGSGSPGARPTCSTTISAPSVPRSTWG